MVKIGDFARAGQVSVRMLRHYDQLGLLRPARVDEWNGHRHYTPDQLHRLDRIVALNQLGFRLDELGELLDDDLSGPQFAARLRERQAALAAEAHAIDLRLAQVTHRLHLIERGETMSTTEIHIKQLPAERFLALPAHAADQPGIATVVGPLFGRVAQAIATAGGVPVTAIASYQWSPSDHPGGDQPADDRPGGVDIVAGFRYQGEPLDGFQVVELPPVEGATLVHLGAMDTISESWAALDRWIGENGYRFDGPCREVYLQSEGDQATWVTELQQGITR